MTDRPHVVREGDRVASRWRYLTIPFQVGAVLMLLGLVVTLPGSRPGWIVPWAAFLTLLGLNCWLIWRVVTAGLICDRVGVTVRGFVRVRRFPWNEIDRFEVWLFWNALAIRTRDGKRHVVQGAAGLNPGLFPGTTRRLELLAERLNDARRNWAS
jgi:hypothetical protein